MVDSFMAQLEVLPLVAVPVAMLLSGREALASTLLPSVPPVKPIAYTAKPALSLQKAVIVVSPTAELYWPLLISAVWEFVPLLLIVQDVGTEIDTSSTTESLSALVIEEDRTTPERRVTPRIPLRAMRLVLLFDSAVFILVVWPFFKC